MAVLGAFRRVDETSFKVLENGKVRVVQKGDLAFLDYEIYKDVWGFRFEGFVRQKPVTKQEVLVEEVRVNKEPTKKIEEDTPGEVKDETIKELKELTKKDFFVMKKDVCKEYLDKLEVDYSNTKDDKWSLVKFLQGIIKEL